MAQRQLNPHLVLEMTMRDVLGNLEEMTSDYGYHAPAGGFEILSIEPPEHGISPAPPDTVPRSRPLFTAQRLGITSQQRVA